MNFRPKLAVRCGVATILAIVLAGCGYHVGGRGSALPPTIHTIAVPALVNRTPRYRIEAKLTQAVVREFLSRTSYRVVSDPAGGDAVLQGEVTSLESSVAVFDTATGRATTMLVTIRLKVSLLDQQTKAVIYSDDNFLFRQPYEISTDVPTFFDEANPALDRMAREFAQRLVAAILEKF
jgi:outer membrane lipopolysaccharide assembly protein LptE/RlpB